MSNHRPVSLYALIEGPIKFTNNAQIQAAITLIIQEALLRIGLFIIYKPSTAKKIDEGIIAENNFKLVYPITAPNKFTTNETIIDEIAP
ncbi:hypothetical protein AWM70_01495 [Paenibacillus yonginensis]|uniref:Uncharacterized protein n=2 Tax=Paenibacillus yonginensis TaxID=1462996 RepID=A0A1B1MW62_9BACL|nr:hypothetical protein AWM70_01495 [Paenibacillus yonginensis]